jgi:NAD(P)-dependent dehydrogenase (short-subunit alcohol dehydrogenase family)
MELKNRVAVVTGAASGIGAALVEAFAREGARVVAADLDVAGASAVAERHGALAVGVDVGDEADLTAALRKVTADVGPVEVMMSNAGISAPGDPFTETAQWDRAWRINLMSHVWAAREVLPAMLDNGAGYLLSTSSAGGLLSTLGAAPYTASKHAAVGFAEWLAITYGGRGIRVSCLCPQAVDTPMMRAAQGTASSAALEAAGAITSEAVAAIVVDAIRDERFLITTNDDTQVFVQRRAEDHQRWLRGMQRLQAKLDG